MILTSSPRALFSAYLRRTRVAFPPRRESPATRVTLRAEGRVCSGKQVAARSEPCRMWQQDHKPRVLGGLPPAPLAEHAAGLVVAGLLKFIKNRFQSTLSIH